MLLTTQPYRIRLFFAWYDFWVGVYVDQKNHTIYVCLLPTIVLECALQRRDADIKPYQDKRRL